MMHDLIPNDVFDRLPEQYRRRARQISERVAEIDRLLVRCKPAAIRDAAVRLCGQLRPQPEIKIDEFAAEFRDACNDLPEWAVFEATNDYLAGRVENHTGQFMPTCAEFARHARAIIRPFASEKAGLRHEAERLFIRAEDDRRRELITIERMDPAVRERVKAMKDLAISGCALPAPAHGRHAGIDCETRAKLDALKKPKVAMPSRLEQTRIVKGSKQ